MNKLFFELIRVSIGTGGGLSRTPSAAEWRSLYDMALKQSLVGICFVGVQRLQKQQQTPPEMLYLKWLGMAAKIQQENEIVLKRCKELYDTLAESGIRCSVLKGASLVPYYGENALLRQSGDIDAYVDCGLEGCMDFAKTIQQESSWDYKHLHLDIFKDVDVELHYRVASLLTPLKNLQWQRWTSQHQVQDLIFGSECRSFKTPTLKFALLHNILHIYHHYCFKGIGLRQVMDCYYLTVASSEDDRVFVHQQLKRYDVLWLASGLMWILTNKFGLFQDKSICPPSEDEGLILLSNIIEGGNFGRDAGMKVRKGKIYNLFRLLSVNSKLLFRHPNVVIGVPFYFLYVNIWQVLTAAKLKRKQKNK